MKETKESKATPTPEKEGKLEKWLRLGSESETVLAVQKQLSKLGYYSEKATGYFGPATEEAVKLFQRANGIEEDGVIGDESYVRLFSSKVIPFKQAMEKNLLSTPKPAATPKPTAKNTTSAPEKTAAPSSGGDKASKIISYAKGFLGCPYVYGAMGPDKFDCSGFTAYVMGQYGVSLPHSSVSQSEKGDKISSISDLKKGDLVFFDTLPNNGSRIDHVGIYIGGGDFIHAGSSNSTGKKVKISTLSSGFYNRVFQWGRRVFD